MKDHYRYKSSQTRKIYIHIQFELPEKRIFLLNNMMIYVSNERNIFLISLAFQTVFGSSLCTHAVHQRDMLIILSIVLIYLPVIA